MSTLDLKLMPPPPLGARQALIVVGATAFVMLLAGLRFLLLGAWPVVPFLVVDLALLVWAFRASARAAHAYETLRLDARGLTVAKVAADGSARSYTLEPFYTRAELEELAPPENRLWLRYRGRRLPVGRFLSPAERREVYQLLRRALGG
jgi:uncharacterized membrane protein